ncbi:MAG: hypothetical protein JRI25_27875 [Deltaproteobacteria bacterium]|nr:hypothetical protein [Deltaproteobacteria bacterium]
MYAALILLVGLLAPGVARADDPEVPRHRLFLENSTAVRINPLGLMEVANLSYRLKLMESDSILFEDTYLMVGPGLFLSPAFVKPGVRVEVMPIALLQLSATYRYQYFLGTFDQIQSWPDPSADWSDTAIEETGDEAYSTGGHQVVLQARLQAKVGPIAVRETTRWEYNDLDITDGTVAYYDQTPDMLVPDKGWLMVSDLDVLYVHPDNTLKAGVRWTYTAPYYGNGLKSEGNDSQRLGPRPSTSPPPWCWPNGTCSTDSGPARTSPRPFRTSRSRSSS